MNGSGGESRHLRVVLHGRAASRPDVRDAVREVREAGHRVEVRVTWEAGDATRLTREAVEDGGLAAYVIGPRDRIGLYPANWSYDAH